MWRSGLVKAMIEKEQSDQILTAERLGNKNWYSIDQFEQNGGGAGQLATETVAKFQLSHFDEETQQFLDASFADSNRLFLQLWYSLAATLLSVFWSKTSVNGVLGRGQMFLFSTAQIRSFLHLVDDWTPNGRKLLDLGAGDGRITSQFSSYFAEIFVTDASSAMQWRLAQRGFTVFSDDDWIKLPVSDAPYTLISALNLLDRHYDPLGLLADLWTLAQSGAPERGESLVLVSLVLPLRPYVEFHQQMAGSIVPLRPLPVEGRSFLAQVDSLIRLVFQPSGFELVRWTRLPYLCEGDLHRAFYRLDDAVFLLRPVAREHTRANSDFLAKTFEVHNEL